MHMKTCKKCLIEKPLEDFARMSKAKDGRQPNCKTCNNAFARQNYEDNKDRYFAQAKKRDKDMRARLRELKSVPCADCKQTFPWPAMDFDHLGEQEKTHDISYMLRHRMAWSKIEAEIAKCEVVCSNCHRVRTALRAGYLDAVDKAPDTMLD